MYRNFTTDKVKCKDVTFSYDERIYTHVEAKSLIINKGTGGLSTVALEQYVLLPLIPMRNRMLSVPLSADRDISIQRKLH